MTELEVRVAVTGQPDGGEDELRSLLRWLRADETLRYDVRGRLTAGTAPAPGSMGAAFDVLQLLIGSGLSAGALAVSVLQWRDSRRRRPGLVLRRGPVEVEISPDAAGSELAERVTALMIRETDGLPDDEPAS